MQRDFKILVNGLVNETQNVSRSKTDFRFQPWNKKLTL